MARAQNSDSSELLMARESLNNLCQHILKMTTPHHTIETHNHDSSDNVEWGLGSSRSGRGANNAAISLVTLSQKQVEDEQEKLAYNDSHVIQKSPPSHVSGVALLFCLSSSLLLIQTGKPQLPCHLLYHTRLASLLWMVGIALAMLCQPLLSSSSTYYQPPPHWTVLSLETAIRVQVRLRFTPS